MRIALGHFPRAAQRTRVRKPKKVSFASPASWSDPDPSGSRQPTRSGTVSTLFLCSLETSYSFSQRREYRLAHGRIVLHAYFDAVGVWATVHIRSSSETGWAV